MDTSMMLNFVLSNFTLNFKNILPDILLSHVNELCNSQLELSYYRLFVFDYFLIGFVQLK